MYLCLARTAELALTEWMCMRASAWPALPEINAKRVTFYAFDCARVFLILLDIGECLSDPCQHGGTCVDNINAFTCICTIGYTGNVCETSKI